jgi:3-deoxy-manno-octulosonate cytidylyltransferase (CMP-KDO synthetase)
MIEQVIAPFLTDQTVEFGSLRRVMDDSDDPNNPNLVKVVCDANDFALYFSRSRIPHNRDEQPGAIGCFAHIGIYAYRREALLRLAAAQPTGLELCEKLEQLRILENGWRIKVPITEHKSLGVDTPQDLELANQLLQESD